MDRLRLKTLLSFSPKWGKMIRSAPVIKRLL